MDTTRYKRSLTVLAVILMAAALVVPVHAAEFSGDIMQISRGDTTAGKIYVKGDRYRMEITQEGEDIIVIVDPSVKKTIVIPVSLGEYRELATDDFLSLMNDPIQAYGHTVERGEEVMSGTETIGGYECDKYTVSMADSEVMSKWVARDLDFPVRIAMYGHGAKDMIISNITETAVEDSQFTVPDGFKAWVDPESLPGKRPEWAGEIPSAPLLIPPFEMEMSAGNIVRVKVEPGRSLFVRGKSESEAEARVIPFKGDQPAKDEMHYYNFAAEGTMCDRRHELTGEADEFIIRVYKGNVKVMAKWQKMFEATASAGDEIRYPITGTEHITTRIINLTEGNAEATFAYHKGGQPMADNEDIPIKYRTISLKNPWDVNSITRVAKGDEFVITVLEGTMQIKLGQFDSFEF